MSVEQRRHSRTQKVPLVSDGHCLCPEVTDWGACLFSKHWDLQQDSATVQRTSLGGQHHSFGIGLMCFLWCKSYWEPLEMKNTVHKIGQFMRASPSLREISFLPLPSEHHDTESNSAFLHRFVIFKARALRFWTAANFQHFHCCFQYITCSLCFSLLYTKSLFAIFYTFCFLGGHF